MKTNAWFRFCLIVLCIAMAASMFACGNKNNDETTLAPNDKTTEAPATQTTEKPTTQTTEKSTTQTTEKPTTQTTEKPATQTTEAPTTETSEAPVTQTTEAPTTETSEAPVTQTTEAPVTQTTEAPTTETTEAPTTETTEAPTTETTEAPTTETTEEPKTETTEDPLTEEFNEFFGKDVLAQVAAPDYYVEETEDGVIFENSLDNDGGLFFFGGRGTDNGPTGQYLFMKYRASTLRPEDGFYIQIYAATDFAQPEGNHVALLNNGVDIYNDDEWHLFIIDLSKVIEMPTDENGDYYIKHLRVDVQGSAMVTIELAYLGLATDLADIVEYARATEETEDLQAICGCIPALQNGTYVDGNVHTTACQLCGKTKEVVHSGAGCGVWNADLGYYVSNVPCAVCGQHYNVGANISVEAENITFWEYGWGTVGAPTTTDDGVNAAIFKAHKNLGAASIGHLAINAGANVSGQHFVFRYRIDPEGEETQRTLGFKFGTTAGTAPASIEITLVTDGEWHIVYMDLSELDAYAADGDGKYIVTNDIVLDATTWGNEALAYIDWFKMYDNAENMPEEYKAGKVTLTQVCDHNNLTVVVEPAVEPTCTTPGKTAVMGCAVCNEYQAGGDEIPAQHKVTVVVEEAVPATCTTPGKTVKMGCENCEYTEGGDEVPAQHKLTEVLEEAVAPTCTAVGKTAKIGCENCEYTEGGEEIPAQHATNSWTESDGKSACAVCGEHFDIYLNYLWDRDNLVDMTFANASWVHTVDGVKYTGVSNPAKQHYNQVIFLEDHATGLANSNYFVIKYKVYAGTDFYLALDFWDGAWQWLDSYLVSDGEWHVLVYECPASTVKTLKLYFNSAEGTPTIEVAYAGVASTEDQVNALLEVKGDTDIVTVPTPPTPPTPPVGGEESSDTTTDEPVEPMDHVWDAEDLAGATVSNATATTTEDGVKFVGSVKGSAADLGAGNVITILGNDGDDMLANCEWFVIKYKASEGTTLDMYLNAGDDGIDGWNLLANDSGLFICDGEWQVLIYDAAGSYADVVKVYFNTVDASSEIEPTIEIAYAGFAKTEAQIKAFVAANEPVDPVDHVWDAEDLVGASVSSATATPTEDGVKFVGSVKGNGDDTSALGTGNSITILEVEQDDLLANCEWFFIKYKANAGTTFDMYLNAADDGTGGWNLLTDEEGTFICDGEWQVLIFDSLGQYADIVKIYFNTEAGSEEEPTIEIAYAGFAKTKAQIDAFVANN